MKKIFIIACVSFSVIKSFAQNVGIGTTDPFNKLHVNGSLLVNTPTNATNTVPTVAQTKTMLNDPGFIFFSPADSTGRIYDPGGPAGNYTTNLYAFAGINSSTNIGFEITVESMQLGTGDSLFIAEDIFSGYPYLLAIGSSTTGKWILNSPSGGLNILFKSNGDANVGSGFSLLFRRLYNNSQTLPDVSGYAGNALFFDTKSGAFSSGGITKEAVPGEYSTAMGFFPKASGYSSTALGRYARASGDNSTALGNGSKASGLNSAALGSGSDASGDNSTAIGNNTTASGSNATSLGYFSLAQGDGSVSIGRLTRAVGSFSTAIGYRTEATGIKSTALGDSVRVTGDEAAAFGYRTLASGDYSMALGISTTASGLRSTAMGYNASTNGHANSFVIGGNGTATNCTSPNQFMTRFDNYTFWISASNYAYLLPASNGWAYTSDKNKKERFEELNGEDVLTKISKIPFCSWNFKAADTRQYRHYGITAQDFYNAFGEDSYGKIGNDTTVSPLDMLGVAYSAIKELEKRTSLLQQQQQEKVNENNQLKTDNLALQQRLDMLEKKINGMALKKDEIVVAKKD